MPLGETIQVNTSPISEMKTIRNISFDKKDYVAESDWLSRFVLRNCGPVSQLQLLKLHGPFREYILLQSVYRSCAIGTITKDTTSEWVSERKKRKNELCAGFTIHALVLPFFHLDIIGYPSRFILGKRANTAGDWCHLVTLTIYTRGDRPCCINQRNKFGKYYIEIALSHLILCSLSYPS